VSEFEKMTPRIAVASFVGTAIELYDFYVYGTAAAIVFGPTFFPSSSEAAQSLSALATFAVAFIARPIGSAIFGHFGDRKGRKTTLVASLLIMGICTTLIGLLPGYQQIGAYAPMALCVLRFGQGIGFGGEWAGAALLVIENAPVTRRTWFAMFPQLGAPVGFIGANGVFLVLAEVLDGDQFRNWGWRLPFLFSAVLVVIGLYVRLKLVETPIFKKMLDREMPVRIPLGELFRHHGRRMILGTLATVACYALFYLSTVFALGYGTSVQKISRSDFLGLECVAIIGMAIAIPISARLCDRFGRYPILLGGLALTALSGALFDRMLGSGSVPTVTLFLFIQLFLMGLIYAPMGAFLPELFPTRVRYTGASITYNLGGILGASFAPYIAQSLANREGLRWVGAYLAIACLVSFVAVLLLGETAGADLAGPPSNGRAAIRAASLAADAAGVDLESSAS
jgi:metabolite-proton symporter